MLCRREDGWTVQVSRRPDVPDYWLIWVVTPDHRRRAVHEYTVDTVGRAFGAYEMLKLMPTRAVEAVWQDLGVELSHAAPLAVVDA